MDELLPCAILVPSLGRAQRLGPLARNIHATTPEEHRILFCVGDPRSRSILEYIGEWYLDDEEDEDKRYVTRMNKLVKHIGDAKTVFFGSDDVLHHQGWLGNALKHMVDGISVVVVNDLRNPHGTQAVIRSEYLQEAVFDDPGAAFHWGYRHNFADSEMFYTAAQRGVLAPAPDAIVEHLHPVFGKPNAAAWDATYRDIVMNPEGWQEDQHRFSERVLRIEAEVR